MIPPRPPALLLLASLICAALPARTLTSADGRKIEAEVLGFEGSDRVTIKRADTGQTFTVPIDTFAESDRAALRTEAAAAAKKPPALRPGDLTLETSRSSFDRRREKKDLPLSDGSIRKNGITITEEDWGYSITLRNNSTRPIEGLRGEYILFVETDAVGDSTLRGDGKLRRTAGKLDFEAIPTGARVTARTETITTRQTELGPGIVWRGTRDDETRDKLHGLWLRIYRGDTLVLETASPENLRQTEAWPSP
jgi:hypothetical protein